MTRGETPERRAVSCMSYGRPQDTSIRPLAGSYDTDASVRDLLQRRLPPLSQTGGGVSICVGVGTIWRDRLVLLLICEGEGSIVGWEYSCCNTSLLTRYDCIMIA